MVPVRPRSWPEVASISHPFPRALPPQTLLPYCLRTSIWPPTHDTPPDPPQCTYEPTATLCTRGNGVYRPVNMQTMATDYSVPLLAESQVRRRGGSGNGPSWSEYCADSCS